MRGDGAGDGKGVDVGGGGAPSGEGYDMGPAGPGRRTGRSGEMGKQKDGQGATAYSPTGIG